METTYDSKLARAPAAWGAVISMAMSAFVLVASEFLPVSLLSPLAQDLSITEGLAGQAISISGVFAVLTSLFVAGATRRLDRRLVVNGFSALLIVSGLIVTFAPNYPVLMLGRVLLGFAIGGFWSMSTAVVMRLVPASTVPRALSLIQGGTALASTISAPLGSLLGSYIGWRGAFFLVVPIALIALVWQMISLPPLPARKAAPSGNVFRLLGRPQVALGMTATMLLFMGQFALFTYLRPYLETVSGFEITALSLVLLLMGFGGVAGTYVAGLAVNTRMFGTAIAIPAVMAVLAVVLVLVPAIPVAVAVVLVAWGFFGTGAPVGWGTWLSRVLPDDAEAGGGLQVAVIQLGITAGAAIGGLLYDAVGWWSPFAMAAVLLAASSITAMAARRNWNSGSGRPPSK